MFNFNVISDMQKVQVVSCHEESTGRERFIKCYGSYERLLPKREYAVPLLYGKSVVALEIKDLEPTDWPARIRRFEVHKIEEVIVTFDQPVVVVVKYQSVDLVEAFLIEPFAKVTLNPGVMHGWVLALRSKTKIIVLYPVENEELLLTGEFSPPTVILPKELCQ